MTNIEIESRAREILYDGRIPLARDEWNSTQVINRLIRMGKEQRRVSTEEEFERCLSIMSLFLCDLCIDRKQGKCKHLFWCPAQKELTKRLERTLP